MPGPLAVGAKEEDVEAKDDDDDEEEEVVDEEEGAKVATPAGGATVA